MKTITTTILGLGLVALIAGPAAAQGQGRGMFGRGGNYAGLLGNESVQKELKFDEKQVEKGKELAEKSMAEMREKFQDLQGLDQEERRTKMTEINREANASALKTAGEFLKPEQIDRLKQIANQARGAQAFAEADVAKKLNLTDAQKTEIQEIQRESMQEIRSIFQDAGDDREAAMKKIAELRKQTLAKAEAKLNDEQRKTWKELLGAPFEIQYPQN
jgi:hypothetical protein